MGGANRRLPAAASPPATLPTVAPGDILLTPHAAYYSVLRKLAVPPEVTAKKRQIKEEIKRLGKQGNGAEK